jgi:hypothetical protein
MVLLFEVPKEEHARMPTLAKAIEQKLIEQI